MKIDKDSEEREALHTQRYWLLAASLLTFLLITLGGTVCVTESGRACPDWPGCFGQVFPPLQINAIIEYSHRLVAIMTSPVIFIAAFFGWRKLRPLQWVSRPPLMAIPFLLAVVVFGALAVLTGLPRGWSAVDLSSALVVLALIVTATVAAFAYYANPGIPERVSLRTPFARLTAWALGAMYLVLVSGVLVSESGSVVRCLGWPMYSPGLASGNRFANLQILRGLFALLAGFMVLAVVFQAWRIQQQPGVIRSVAASIGLLFLAEIGVGAILTISGFAQALLVAYVALAAALWALLVALLVLAGLDLPETPTRPAAATRPAETTM